MLRLKAERLAREWSQFKVGGLAGVHPAELSRIERGMARPNPKQAERLARVLGIPADQLQEEVELQAVAS